jgi:hypothetical protein
MTFSAWLVLYFCAQALCYVFGWGTWLIVGPGWLYGWVFGLTTGTILLTCLGMAWEALWDRTNRVQVLALAFLLSGAPCRFAYTHMGHPAGWADWLILSEALVLIWSGTILAVMSPHRHYKWVMFTLGGYWLLRGMWDLCYLLNLPRCMPLNAWVPTTLNLASLATILLLLRPRQPRSSSVSPVSPLGPSAR